MYNIDYKPKYIKVYESLKREITIGVIKNGDKILSEREIMQKHNVSSTTVRKAVDLLKNEHLIERIQGKGTFVAQKKIVRSLRKVISFTKNMEKQKIVPSAKIIKKEILGGHTVYHDKLKLKRGEKILKIKRIKYGDNVPFLIDTRYINLRYCSDIIERDLTGSLYEIYRDYNIKITHTSQFLELTFLDKKNAKLLGCKESDPVIYIEGLLYMDNSTPIEYEEDLWNGRVFRFYAEANL